MKIATDSPTLSRDANPREISVSGIAAQSDSRHPGFRFPAAIKLTLGLILLLLALPGTVCAQNSTIILRSGNGMLGGTDAAITFLPAPSTETSFPNQFTVADFANASGGQPAIIVPPYGGLGVWLPQLAGDTQSKWIATNASYSSQDTALYAINFTLSSVPIGASLTLNYAVDNQLGGGPNGSVYINGILVAGTQGDGQSESDFEQEQTLSVPNIAPYLHTGVNTLYINATNYGGPAGLLFRAEITPSSNLPAPPSPTSPLATSGTGNAAYLQGNGVLPDQDTTVSSLELDAGSTLITYAGQVLSATNGLYIDQGATWEGSGTVIGNVYNSGLIDILLSGESILYNAGSATITGTGGGAVVNYGNAMCSGTIGSYNNAGQSDFDGLLTVDGTFTQTQSGVTEFHIRGYTQQVDYSFLHVTQSASLAGAFNADLLNGFVPAPGSKFDLFEADGGITIAPSGLTANLPQGFTWALVGNNTIFEATAFTGAFTGGVSGYSDGGAVLSGSANPLGVPANAWFQYGTDVTYGSQTTPQALGSGTNYINVSAALTGLTPGATYHYDLVSASTSGTYYGGDQKFTALGLPNYPATNATVTGTLGSLFNYQDAALGGDVTYSAGSLPSGLAYGSDGVITGTALESGTFDATLTASNLIGTATTALTVVITCPFTYTITNSNTITLTRYAGTGGVVTIPTTINGLPVTSIAAGAFDGSPVTGLVVPGSVTSIAGGAFSGCPALASINVDPLNPTYASAGGVLFNLTQTELIQYPAAESGTSYTISAGVTTVDAEAFEGCANLQSLAIPASVTSIGDRAFLNCAALASISVDPQNLDYSSVGGVLFNQNGNTLIQYPEGDTGASYAIPGGVTSIGDYAFASCTNLFSVTIPGGVTSIGDDAFENCGNLSEVLFLGGAPATGSGIFDGDAGEFTVNYFDGQSGFISPTWTDSAGDQYTSVGQGAPVVSAGIETLNVGTAFDYQIATTSIALSYSASNLAPGLACDPSAGLISGTPTGTGTFTAILTASNPAGTGTANLVLVVPCPYNYTITGSNTVTITQYTGSGGAVTIPVTINGLPVTAIGVGAFAGLLDLTSVTIPSGVTSIGDNAFLACNFLASVTIPGSVTSIGNFAFAGCGLATVIIPASVTSIGDAPFEACRNLTAITVDPQNPQYSSLNGVLFDKNYDVLLEYPDRNQGTFTYTIPSSVTQIGDYAFAACPLTSVTIPSGVTSIGNYSFNGDFSLTSVAIPNGVASIGDHAFEACYSLSGVTIPASVTSIGASAFATTGLTRVTIPGTVTSIGDEAFSQCTLLTSVTISNGVTSIGDYAFQYCGLTTVSIPNSVTSIGSAPFEFCNRLSSITVGSPNPQYSSVGGVLFDENQQTLIEYPVATSGTSYVIPGSVSSIDDSAFAGSGLTSVTIPSSVTSISANAFAFSTRLKSVTIPGSVTSIGDFAFEGCGLTSATIPASVTLVGVAPFEGCNSLTSITVAMQNPQYSGLNGVLFDKGYDALIEYPGGASSANYMIPGSVNSIASSAFEDCAHLKTVNIPGSVNSIGDNGFLGCNALTAAVFTGSAPAIGSNAFGDDASTFAIYYFVGAAGFTLPVWNGFPSYALVPPVVFAPVVTSTSVTLSASVNPNGLAGPSTNKTNVLVSWQYGVTAGTYTTATAAKPIGSGTSAVPASITVAKGKLTGIYHYQLVISSTIGYIYGPDQVFSFAPPTLAYSHPASTGTDSTLSVTINPNGLDTTVSVQYGPTTAYTSGTMPVGDIGSGFAPVTVSPDLTGLIPNTLYYYRVVTTNALGTVSGPAQEFTTQPLYGTAAVVSTKQAAPGIPGAAFSVLGIPIMNDLDHTAFQSAVTGSGVTTTGSNANNSGIWADIGTHGLTLIARTGTSAPDYTGTSRVGTFAKLSDPVYADCDAVAFLGTLVVTGTVPGTVTTANDTGIWATASGTTNGPLLLVARAGDRAPDEYGATSGSSPVFASFTQFVLPDQGGVVFLATLKSGTALAPAPGGVIATDNIGIWAVDTNGILKEIIRTGSGLTVNGSPKIVSALAIFNTPAASTGQTRHFNNPGDLAYKVTFTDGSSGFVESVFP